VHFFAFILYEEGSHNRYVSIIILGVAATCKRQSEKPVRLVSLGF
jgi:hypothetical protein